LDGVNRRPVFFLLSLVLLSSCLVGCSVLFHSPTLRTEIDPDWKPGDEWTVRVTYWPDRAVNPYAESSDKVVTRWTYRVIQDQKSTPSTRLVVSHNTSRYLLEFNRRFNLTTVNEPMESSGPVTKVRNLLKSPTGGKAFLVRGWKPDTAAIWVHPDLSEPLSFIRQNYVTGRRSSEAWLTQTVRVQDDTYRIELEHKPSQSRAVFYWPKGASWWSEAVYFRRKRLILSAKRMVEP
jgi:hypothetical protein